MRGHGDGAALASTGEPGSCRDGGLSKTKGGLRIALEDEERRSWLEAKIGDWVKATRKAKHAQLHGANGKGI